MGRSCEALSIGVDSPLTHEEVIDPLVDPIAEAWRNGAPQETPVLILRHAGVDIVADGHHRIAAALRLGAVQLQAVVADQLALMPAHRVVHRSPAGWLAGLETQLARRTRRGSTGIGIQQGDRTEYFGCDGLSTEQQMRLLWRCADFTAPGLDWSIHGESDVVILVPAFTVEEVVALARNRRLLPPKSTNFQPKPQPGSISAPIVYR